MVTIKEAATTFLANRRIAVCVGMSFWKRRRIADFVRSAAGVPVFRRTVVPRCWSQRRMPSVTSSSVLSSTRVSMGKGGRCPMPMTWIGSMSQSGPGSR